MFRANLLPRLVFVQGKRMVFCVYFNTNNIDSFSEHNAIFKIFLKSLYEFVYKSAVLLYNQDSYFVSDRFTRTYSTVAYFSWIILMNLQKAIVQLVLFGCIICLIMHIFVRYVILSIWRYFIFVTSIWVCIFKALTYPLYIRM